MSSEGGDVEAGPVEFGDCVDVGFVLAEQFYDVVVSFVAGEVEGGPVVEGFVVD